MQVLSLTIALSLLLAALFVVFFFWAVQRSNSGSLEQESLQPLRDDTPRPAEPGQPDEEPVATD
jgi:nitrogen fixation-related uncharacterized protein